MDNLLSLKQAYVVALENDQDTSMLVQALINADCQLSEKYLTIRMDQVIELNCQDVNQLRRITIALSILEKYTRHLLKPEEERSNMWKYVKFSNMIFKERVDAIQGGRDLMKMMGYTKDIKDGLAFPDNGETDPERLLHMLADIILGKQELNLYLTGSHPHEHFIDSLLPKETLEELKRFQGKLQQIDPNSIRESVTSQPSFQQEIVNSNVQNRVAPSQFSPSAIQNRPTEPSQQIQNPQYRPPANQLQHGYPTVVQDTPSVPSQMPFVQPVTSNAQQLHNPPPSLGEKIDSNQIPVFAKELAQGRSVILSFEDTERSHSAYTTPPIKPESTYQSTSLKPANVSSEESQTASSASLVTVKQAPAAQYNSASDSMGQTSTEESVFPSGSACDICGNRQAEIICEICDNKQLCKGCDDKWHQHPRRQNHQRQHMGALDDQSSPINRNVSSSQGDRRGDMRMSSSPRNEMSHGGGDDVYVTANYNSPQPKNFERQSEKGPVSNQMQNLRMEEYSTRRKSSSSESAMAEISPGIEPQSVQTGHWTGHQQLPYNYSHQTNLIRPTQNYVSSGPSQYMPSSPQTGSFQGNQQFIANQHFIGNQQLPRNQQYQGPQSFQVGSPSLQPNSQSSQQQSLSSAAPGGPPTSRLLPTIKSIPDYNRRKSKLDINLMTLREEIEEVEVKITELISQNAHFFSDPEYATLYKRKGMLTREKLELEKYDKELEQYLREEDQSSMSARKGSLPDVLTQPVIYPPPYSSGAPTHVQTQPQLVNPSGGYVVYHYVPTTMPPGGSLSPETQLAYSLIPTTPQMVPQYGQNYRNQNRMSESQGVYQSPPQLQSAHQQQYSSTLPRRQENKYNQNQYTGSLPRQSSEGKVQNTSPVTIVKPQHKMHDTMQIEEKQNQQNILKQSPPVPHRKSIGEIPHSYVNLPNVPTSVVQNTAVSHSKESGIGRAWICTHCTYHNVTVKEGAPNVCEVCSKTSVNPEYVSENRKNEVGIGYTADQKDASNDLEDETEVMEVGRHIGEVTDKIYLEKIAAQKQFKEQVEREKLQQANMKSSLSKPKMPDPATPKSKPELQKSESTPKMINRPKESPSALINTPPFSGGRLSGSIPGKNFAETMEDLQRRKQQEEMAYEGKKLLLMLKNLEKDGIDAEEVEIAVELCGDLSLDKWMKEKWMPKVDTVIHMATNHGAQMDQNDVGELSVTESKEALKQNNCDANKAALKCVENRQKLYKEIQKYGNFAREEILQAMLHTQGDLESSVDELNSKWLQLFHDRLWQSEDGIQQPIEEDPFVLDQQTQQALAFARATSECCNSVTNSVLSHTTFQNLIKDRNIDLERRIRLILVEGKLQSWGRAEIVIRILDEEVAQDKLEASLEEVVEAVRNCGDRASSLIFLKQYCECCYSQFPMSKIRNLGCSCKLCVQCVQQNFEVAIRERHVRNMNCPLCSQPNMENMEAASDYLTFLSMLLQTMLSQETMELYHSKLRDWHLQKDDNFRWCVHCGNGFIWTVGNQTLKMVCPTCQRGTCFSCKKMWEDQHEGLTCEQFMQWKMDNDPENQTAGLARYLEDNGIDCPSCKMKYSLAKGGCMHFKCPQCGFEFCSGCSQPFYQKGVCRRYTSCRNKGLHCHHPRNCLYYLRDEDFEALQKLLKNNKIPFNTTVPDQEAGRTCPVMEQKEDPEGKRDEPCGREVEQGFAGLCPIHFKEYLVSLINKKKVDPLAIMSIDAMKRLIEREEKKVPERKSNDSDAKYRKHLEQFIREIEPLTRED